MKHADKTPMLSPIPLHPNKDHVHYEILERGLHSGSRVIKEPRGQHLLLLKLLLNPGKVLTYRTLFESTRGVSLDVFSPSIARQEYIAVNTLRPQVSRLRRDLRRLDISLADIIQTIRSVGFEYRPLGTGTSKKKHR